jgi:tetratricopeptide (TPR) repeat protein
MTAPDTRAMSNCPDNERLATFIDGRLRGEERKAVLEHIANCAECREIVMVADEVASSEAREENVVRGRFKPRMILPAAAAAAMVTVLFLGPFRDNDMEKLAKAAGKLDKRVTAARFSADFPYRSQRTLRSGDEAELDYEVGEVASEVAAKAEKKQNAGNLHAAGVAYLLLGPTYLDRAVQALEAANAKNPRNAAVLNDLSAAYIADGNYERALQTASESAALQDTEAAAWNRAFSLRYLGRTDQEKAAWQHYLQLDPDSEWAKEARVHLADLAE